MNAPLRPWLGLASFTEAHAAQFFGREAEVAELVRRLSRKGLTVLFGQSGLGKTSMLQAGVVPRLREAGFAPVLLRMDYSAESPSPGAQMLAALGWSGDEGLWEQLHRRDRDGPAPLLIFDQFEEVFTLGQADEAGRVKAATFLAELADLVENRVPAALESRLEQDDSLFDRYDLQRGDFRLLISLREDYLAHLEPLKGSMPGITQNRMRIAPMTGEQALQAVCGPGGELVSTDTAEAIVRFVSGARILEHAQVEPALLSLILRELNEQRIAKGQAQITPDLLAGSHAAILSDFYERSLADQPSGVRHFIEDQLLTDTGYRENVAEERVKQAFAQAGAAQDALEQLVNRRLLRVEERLDRRRVELTHDTLCAVVQASRENRRERERAAAAERLALEQQASEQRALAQAQAARRTALRARWVAGISATLGVAAVVASAMAYRYFSLADQTRSNAQALTTFLLDDFAAELSPTGRLDVVAQLAQRAVDYYRAVPQALRSDETLIQEAMARTRLGSARATQYRLPEARAAMAQARALLQPLLDRNPDNAALRLAMADVLNGDMLVAWGDGDQAQGLKLALEVDRLLAPLPPPATPDAIALQMMRYRALAIFHAFNEQGKEAAAAGDALLALVKAHGGWAGGSNRRVTSDFINSAWWIPLGMLRAGREADAQALTAMLMERADWLLKTQPDHQWALALRAEIARRQGWAAADRLRVRESLALHLAAQQDQERLVKLDTGNGIYAAGSALNLLDIANRQVALGEISAAMRAYEAADEAVRKLPAVGDSLRHRLGAGLAVAYGELQTGRLKELRSRMQALWPLTEQLAAFPRARFQLLIRQRLAWAKLHDGQGREAQADLREALSAFQAAVRALEQAGSPLSAPEQRLAQRMEFWIRDTLCEAALRARDDTQALHECGRARDLEALGAAEDRALALSTISFALAQARAGQRDAARDTLAPVLARRAQWAQQEPDNQLLRMTLGRALLVQAFIEPDRRLAHLQRARALHDALPPEMHSLAYYRLWSGWINEELAKR